MASEKGQSQNGLSPLARGTLSDRLLTIPLYRFIPAGAGNTPRAMLPARQKTVYPRWRGEHILTYTPRINNIGLSPLARGTLQRMEND